MLIIGIVCVAGGLYFWPKETRQQEKTKQEQRNYQYDCFNWYQLMHKLKKDNFYELY